MSEPNRPDERFTLASGIYTSNCAFVSTGDMTRTNPSEPFTFLMEASMLGIGVGFVAGAGLAAVDRAGGVGHGRHPGITVRLELRPADPALPGRLEALQEDPLAHDLAGAGVHVLGLPHLCRPLHRLHRPVAGQVGAALLQPRVADARREQPLVDDQALPGHVAPGAARGRKGKAADLGFKPSDIVRVE